MVENDLVFKNLESEFGSTNVTGTAQDDARCGLGEGVAPWPSASWQPINMGARAPLETRRNHR